MSKSATKQDFVRPHALVTVDGAEASCITIDTIPVAMIQCDIKGNLIKVNKKTEELLGYTKKELTRMHFTQIYPKEEFEKTTAAFNEIVKKGTTQLTNELLLRKDGETVPVDLAANAVGSSGKKLIQVLFQDDTRLKEIENELTKSMNDVKERDEAIRTMSTPLVDTWEDIVMIPLVGILDSARAQQITESILKRIAEEKSQIIVILSIGGIAAIDTKAANHILKTVHAVKLMGSEMIITGIRPDVAATLVTLGIDLAGIVTRSHLREGLLYAFDKLGWKVTKNS